MGASNLKRSFNELVGVLAYFREWKIPVNRIEELLFWVGFGLGSLVIEGISGIPRQDSNLDYVIPTTRRSATFSVLRYAVF
jgi:hypothetical protein